MPLHRQRCSGRACSTGSCLIYQANLEKMKIVDFHTHAGSYYAYGRPSAAKQVELMLKNGVEKAIVSNINALRSNCHNFKEENDWLAKYVSEFPDNLYAYAVVNPFNGGKAVSEFRRCVEELGMRGLKLHPWLQGFSCSDNDIRPIVEESIRLNVPIIFHDGTPPYSTPLQIANLARMYPEATIISGHSGLNDLWKNAIDGAKRNKNFYLCLCGPSTLAMERIINEVDINQIVFGTDLVNDRGKYFVYRLHKFQQLNISDEKKRKILWDNALKLLKL